MTNMQAVARDAHEHIFASAGALTFINESSGAAASPAPVVLKNSVVTTQLPSLITINSFGS
jgi:hypothetical protein